ncbi:MAG: hypothetical protein GY865_14370 [candidate division Zixibacteria bacterium]|nr:hypothetical protein [candidate division Zixibacteria bacterium]
MPKFMDYNYLSNDIISNIDSLAIHASLLDAIAERTDSNSGVIIVEYGLINLSSRPLSVYFYSPSLEWHTSRTRWIGFGFTFGKDEDQYKYRNEQMCVNAIMGDSSQFTIIPSYDSISFVDTIDVIKYGGFGDQTMDTGEYWIQLYYRNNLYCHSYTGPWIGDIQSNVLKFYIK